MKYFAILKDSLREALDSKVLYVLLGLALLMILLVATISFRPLSAEKSIAEIVDGRMIHYVTALRPETGEPKRKKKENGKEDGKDDPFAVDLAISDYRMVADKPIEVLRGETDSPNSDYRFTIKKMFFNEAAAAKVRAQPDAELDTLRKYFARMEKLGFFHIGAVQVVPEEPERAFVEFTVELHSTSGTRRLWVHEPSMFFGLFPMEQLAAPLGFQLFIVANFVVSFGAWIAVLLGVVITSFFIPNMLQKGTVDLLLVKPIRRSFLLAFKYVGGLTFILLTNAFAIVGIWLVLGLRSGLWANWMLLLVPILTFFFAILYSVSTLLAVLTRSTVTAILVTIGVWFALFLVGATNAFFEMKVFEEEVRKVPPDKQLFTDNSFGKVIKILHRVLPRTSDLDQLADLLMFSDFMTGGYQSPQDVLVSNRNWWESFGVSMAFIVVVLGLACWRFACKDY